MTGVWEQGRAMAQATYKNMVKRFDAKTDEWFNETWTLVEPISSKTWKVLVSTLRSLLGFVVGFVLLPLIVFMGSYSTGIDDRDPAWVAVPSVMSTPGNILCVHHTVVISLSWAQQSLLFLNPEESWLSPPLITILLVCMVSETRCWPAFDSNTFFLRRVLHFVDKNGLNPFGKIWFRLTQLAISISIWTFLKARWTGISQAVVGYDDQRPLFWIMFVLGALCSVCTWGYWAEYALVMDCNSTTGYILCLILLGHFFLARLPEDAVHCDHGRKMNISRMVVLAHHICLVKIYEPKLWKLKFSAALPVAASNVVFYYLLLTNRKDIVQEMDRFLASEQDVPREPIAK